MDYQKKIPVLMATKKGSIFGQLLFIFQDNYGGKEMAIMLTLIII